MWCNILQIQQTVGQHLAASFSSYESSTSAVTGYSGQFNFSYQNKARISFITGTPRIAHASAYHDLMGKFIDFETV